MTVFSAAAYPSESGDNNGAILHLKPDGSHQIEKYTRKDTILCFNDGAKLARRSTTKEMAGDQKLRKSIGGSVTKLRQNFQRAQNGDGKVTVEQWTNIMSKTLTDLPGLPWKDLQPELAPSTSLQNLVDWEEFLTPYSVSFGGDASSQAKIIQANHEELIELFKKMDTDGDGVLSFTEFQAGVTILNQRLPKDEQITNPQKVFNTLDLQEKGVISFEEFEEGSQSRVFGAVVGEAAEVLHENFEMLLTVFKYLDKDHSGSLSLDEFVTGIALLNRRLPKERQIAKPKELFKALDIDGNGEVTVEEFTAGFRTVAA